MVRGPKKHLKRLNAPKHWMLDKLGGIFVSPADGGWTVMVCPQSMTGCWPAVGAPGLGLRRGPTRVVRHALRWLPPLSVTVPWPAHAGSQAQRRPTQDPGVPATHPAAAQPSEVSADHLSTPGREN